jgi:cytoskeletal protein CcmA (bactofilin family)
MPEIGRISGQMLRENLTRDGVNLRFENNLIYLDVNSHAADVTSQPSNPTSWTGNVGIRNTNPAYPLDVQGTTRSNVLLVKPNASYSAYAEIDDVNIDGNKIQSIAGNLVLQSATSSDRVQVNSNLEVTGNYLTTNQTSFNLLDSTATTIQAFGAATTLVFSTLGGTTTFRSDVVINQDLQIKGGDLTTNASTFNLFNADASTINAFGAASTITIGAPLSGTTRIRNNLKVDGDLEVVGDITLGGSINIGDAPTDNVVFGADVNSSIIPNIASSYDLGTLAKPWRAGYFDDVLVDGLSVGNITVIGSFLNDQVEIVGNQIRTFRSNADLELDTAGTGQVVVLGQGGMILPVGTTAERPSPARTGTIRLNTDTQRVENFNGIAWNRMLHDDDAIAFAIALG